MGIFDGDLLGWLSGSLGGSSLDGASSLPPSAPQQAPPVDTVLPQQVDSPSLQPQTPYDAAMPGGDPGAGPQPPVPLPQPRPANADAGGSLPPLPTGQVPPAPSPMDAGPPTDISAQSATPSPGAMPPGPPPGMPPMGMPPGMPQGAPAPGAPQGASTFLGRAFGLNQQDERRMRGSLASGLKSVGENAHKPGLAAFSGSAGSAMEGGNKSDDKLFDERQKALTTMIAAKAKGDTATYQSAQMDYLKAKIALEQRKAADPAAAKAAMSPEQRAVKIQGMISADQQVRSARDLLRTAATSKEKQAAQAKLDSLVTSKQKEFEAALTPGSQTNPLKPSSPDDLKGYQPGQFFINPADGKAYRYKGTPDKAATPTPAADAANGTPADTDKDE